MRHINGSNRNLFSSFSESSTEQVRLFARKEVYYEEKLSPWDDL